MWILNDFSVNSFTSFFGRYVFFVLTLSGFIFIVNKRQKHLWLFVGIFFFIHMQPLLGGPLVTSGNIQRLSALSLPFLIPLIVYSDVKEKTMGIFVIVSILTSFHHQKSIVYYLDPNLGKIIFTVLVFFTLLISLYVKFFLKKSKT